MLLLLLREPAQKSRGRVGVKDIGGGGVNLFENLSSDLCKSQEATKVFFKKSQIIFKNAFLKGVGKRVAFNKNFILGKDM